MKDLGRELLKLLRAVESYVGKDGNCYHIAEGMIAARNEYHKTVKHLAGRIRRQRKIIKDTERERREIAGKIAGLQARIDSLNFELSAEIAKRTYAEIAQEREAIQITETDQDRTKEIENRARHELENRRAQIERARTGAFCAAMNEATYKAIAKTNAAMPWFNENDLHIPGCYQNACGCQRIPF